MHNLEIGDRVVVELGMRAGEEASSPLGSDRQHNWDASPRCPVPPRLWPH